MMKMKLGLFFLLISLGLQAQALRCENILYKLSESPIFTDPLLEGVYSGDHMSARKFVKENSEAKIYEMSFLRGSVGKISRTDLMNIFLIRNIEMGKHEAVKELLKSDLVELNDNRLSTLTPLLTAIKSGDAKMVEIVGRESRVDVNKSIFNDRSILGYAVHLGNVDVVKAVLSLKGIELNQLAVEIAHPLSIAIRKRDRAIFDLLMSDSRANPSGLEGSVTTPLIETMRLGEREFMNSLLRDSRLDDGVKNAEGRVARTYLKTSGDVLRYNAPLN